MTTGTAGEPRAAAQPGRLGADGRYHGDLPCRWCGALLDQEGRRRVRRYCRWTHRWKQYGTAVATVVLGLF
jgi:hypothetical protein